MGRVSKCAPPVTYFELIHRRRRQLAVHSFIYYRLDDNIISDHKWQEWGQELIELHVKYPMHTDALDKYFVDWDGSTGFHLCEIPGVAIRANQLIWDRDNGYGKSK